MFEIVPSMAAHHCVRCYYRGGAVQLDDLSGVGSSDGPAEEIRCRARICIQTAVRLLHYTRDFLSNH